jgi:hypothetical protein
MKENERQIAGLIDSKLFANFRVALVVNEIKICDFLRGALKLYVEDTEFQSKVNQAAK